MFFWPHTGATTTTGRVPEEQKKKIRRRPNSNGCTATVSKDADHRSIAWFARCSWRAEDRETSLWRTRDTSAASAASYSNKKQCETVWSCVFRRCAEACAVLRKHGDATRLFWSPTFDGEHADAADRTAAFGHLVEGLLQQELPEVHNAFKVSRRL